MPLNTFQTEVGKILKAVLQIDDLAGAGYGYPEKDLANAEKRLGMVLPPALRFMYANLGRHKIWRESHHPLVPPRSLKLVDGKLVFLRECQRVIENLLLPELTEGKADDWENPRVFQRDPQDPGEHYEEPHRLQMFLLEGMCWQIVYSGEDLDENAKIDCFSLYYNEAMSHEQARGLVSHFNRATLLEDDTEWRTAAYYGEREIAFLFAYPEQTIVYAWSEGDEES